MDRRPQLHAVPGTGPVDVAAVYQAHHDFVWRCMHHLGVPAASVDDATQDVFVVVHRRIGDYDGRAPIRAWLFGIARRVAQRHRRAKPPVHGVRLAAELVPPDEEVARRQAGAIVREFLAKLGVEQREVFILAELEQMSAPEIASALGLSVNTVYSRLRLARGHLERALRRARAKDAREGRA